MSDHLTLVEPSEEAGAESPMLSNWVCRESFL
jgi:hypothetical protein